jgi:hypothetical protein
MLLGNLAQYGGLALASACEQDVDFAFLLLDRMDMAIESRHKPAPQAHR